MPKEIVLCSICGMAVASLGPGKWRHKKAASDGHKPVVVIGKNATAVIVATKWHQFLVPPAPGIIQANILEGIKILDPMAGAIGQLYDACEDLETAKAVDGLLSAWVAEPIIPKEI